MRDEQFTQILKAINDVRDDLKAFKDENNKRWDENDKRWAENDKRWAENDKRWIENDKALAKINKKLDKIDEKMERRYKDTLKVFYSYEESVGNMYQDNREKILALEKRLKIANI